MRIFAVLSLLASLVAANNSTYGATTCVCTTAPCPVSGSNSLKVGGGVTATYHYATHNGHAVVTSASVTITKSDLDKGSDTTQCTQDYSRTLDDDGVQDCDAGHILAHRLGGPGNQPINIFPQDLSINRGAYAQYEDSINTCVYAGDHAALSWTFSYASTSHTKPNKVVYTATYTGGHCASTTQSFTN
jgi:hypothetical protein